MKYRHYKRIIYREDKYFCGECLHFTCNVMSASVWKENKLHIKVSFIM